MKCFILSVIIGDMGIVTKRLKKYLETIPGKHSVDFIKKTAALGISHIMMKLIVGHTTDSKSEVPLLLYYITLYYTIL
jgi:hypothetical protein